MDPCNKDLHSGGSGGDQIFGHDKKVKEKSEKSNFSYFFILTEKIKII